MGVNMDVEPCSLSFPKPMFSIKRRAMQLKSLIVVFFLVHALESLGQTEVPIPTQAQLNWQNAELVALFSYDLHVFDGKNYNQQQNRITPIADFNIFNPQKLNTDQWIKAAKDAGIKIAILTATHETGFALYQSDVNPYCLKAVKWRDGKGDIVKDFVESCRKYGVQPGIYIGIRWNSFYGVFDFMVNGSGKFAENRQKHYNKVCEGMVEELMSRYGDLAIVWFDGGAHGPEKGGPDVLSVFRKYQSNCVFYHNTQRADIRWGGSESGTVPYPSWGTFNFPFSHSANQEVVFKNDFQLLKVGDPDGKYYMPAMADAPLRGYKGRHEWFWEPGDESHIFPVGKLVNMYYESVGHNASLILGLTPDPDGLIPQQDVDTLKAFGDAIKSSFSNPVAVAKGEGKEIVLILPKAKMFDQIVIAEEVEKGQRIREFSVQLYRNRKWETIASGTSIGYKFITRLPVPVSGDKLRLLVSISIGKPFIKQLAVY
jgi:alpha-L-fucosidase